ncbi:hypothetical protein DAI22_02g079350 [Oryza sativa Japonica Group]|nr:hypothetical protein DAI22_02g079350 [Oryza sativa Japonica Group]
MHAPSHRTPHPHQHHSWCVHPPPHPHPSNRFIASAPAPRPCRACTLPPPTSAPRRPLVSPKSRAPRGAAPHSTPLKSISLYPLLPLLLFVPFPPPLSPSPTPLSSPIYSSPFCPIALAIGFRFAAAAAAFRL